MMKIFVGLIVSTFLFAGLWGCGASEQYGSPLSKADLVTIQSIMKDPQAYLDKRVRLRGKIVTECPTGCWFDVQDETGTLYVDVKASGFAIPQRVGKEIIVEGEVSERGGKPIVIGEGVKIK